MQRVTAHRCSCGRRAKAASIPSRRFYEARKSVIVPSLVYAYATSMLDADQQRWAGRGGVFNLARAVLYTEVMIDVLVLSSNGIRRVDE